MFTLLWRITYKNRYVTRSCSSKLWMSFEKGNWCFKIVWKNFYLIPHQFLLSVRIMHHHDIFILFSSLLILQLKIISKGHVSRLMKDNNAKFPSNYSSRKSLQVYSYMLPLFSDKYTIHTNKKKNLSLKTNNKQNSTMGNLVKKLRILQSGLVSLQY